MAGRGARDVALRVLTRVDKGEAFAAAVLGSELEKTGDRREAALATELVFGVLRRRSWLDGILESASDRGLARIDPEIIEILRLGAYQIGFLERVPARAAVNEAVRQAKASRAARLSGLVNALLRRLAERPEDSLRPIERDDGAAQAELAVRFGLPEWLLARLIKGYGRERALGMAKAWCDAPRRTLRINVNRTSRDEIAKRLTGSGAVGIHSPWSMDVTDPTAAEELVAQGLADYQDEGAQLAVLALDPAPGDRVLDACAGRGGKTAAMAMATDGKADIVAVDRNRSKLERLVFELDRQGMTARTVTADLAAGSQDLDGPFDRILLDAPCTGTGTLGRRPEIRWRLKPSASSELSSIQSRMLDAVADLLAPGGRLVYSVCSVLPEEGVDLVDPFLERHPDFDLVQEPHDEWPDAIPWNGGQTLIDPATAGTDGYQIITFVRSR